MPLIGEVADRAGVSVQTVRYYERLGILPRAQRRASGYREFDPDAVALVRFIKRAQELGFSLRELSDLVELRRAPALACDTVRARVSSKVDAIENKIRALTRLRGELSALLASCGGEVQSCPVQTLGQVDANGKGARRSRRRAAS